MPKSSPAVERTACPLCRSGSYAPRLAIDDHSIVSCRGCGFVYVIDPVDHSAIKKFGPARKRSTKQRHWVLANFARLIGARTVLEVGSGVGELGLIMQGQGFNYIGVEPDQQRAELCREVGLDVRSITLEQLSLERKADLVVIDNVLEHVINPIGILSSSRNFLNAGGMVAVIVPNRRDVRRFVPSWRRKNLWVPKVHINYFTRNTLQSAFSRAGLEP
ncbi:class I SAM-dependent methyltransferase, partial [Dehalococcoides mccartyi]|nr:class I SAM-dependent methyltransferase [Dehalococcoides mccartyi]